MRKAIYLLTAFILIMSSCNDGDPSTPDAYACFRVSPIITSITPLRAGEDIHFTSCAENATSVLWRFGDGDTSTVENPTHIYKKGGDYNVQFYAFNSTSADEISKIITIESEPKIYFGNWKCTGYDLFDCDDSSWNHYYPPASEEWGIYFINDSIYTSGDGYERRYTMDGDTMNHDLGFPWLITCNGISLTLEAVQRNQYGCFAIWYYERIYDY